MLCFVEEYSVKNSTFSVLIFLMVIAFLFACVSSKAEPDPKALEHYQLAEDYASQGQMDLAIEQYTKAISVDPEYVAAYSNRGIAYQHIDDYDQAIADFTQAITLDPEHVLSYYQRAVVYHHQGDLDKAISDLNRATELDSNYALAYAVSGQVYFELGEIELAIVNYEKALELDLPGYHKQVIEEILRDLRP
jgi:tetratricopeptide (TPR) repeat protein